MQVPGGPTDGCGWTLLLLRCPRCPRAGVGLLVDKARGYGARTAAGLLVYWLGPDTAGCGVAVALVPVSALWWVELASRRC